MLRHLKIMVIDDDPDLLRGLGIRLISEGYCVTVAATAHSALDSVLRAEPDLILLDLGLPDDDGLQVLKRLKGIQAAAGIPVIVISARDDSCEEEVLAAGALAFFQKPVENDELFEFIALALEDAGEQVAG
jgi:two-component system KDP operon response regulator KdpE